MAQAVTLQLWTCYPRHASNAVLDKDALSQAKGAAFFRAAYSDADFQDNYEFARKKQLSGCTTLAKLQLRNYR